MIWLILCQKNRNTYINNNISRQETPNNVCKGLRSKGVQAEGLEVTVMMMVVMMVVAMMALLVKVVVVVIVIHQASQSQTLHVCHVCLYNDPVSTTQLQFHGSCQL